MTTWQTCTRHGCDLDQHPAARLVGGFADGELVELHRPSGKWPDIIEVPVPVRETATSTDWITQSYHRDWGEPGYVYKFRPEYSVAE